MKIGILTYHRTLNYGACLQAVATRLVLEQLGYEAYYVDYWPEYHQKQYAVFSWTKFWQGNYRYKIRYLINTAHTFPFVRKRQIKFKEFQNKYIIPYCRSINEQYDIVLYGSDQIWRKQEPEKKYNPVYFGNNTIPTSKHVAFSASMGVLPESINDKAIIKELVAHLDKVAVRENDLKELLIELGVENVKQTLDPTLLVEASVWDASIPQPQYHGKDYLLVYALHPEVFDMNKVRSFAANKGLEIKILLGKATCKDSDTMYSSSDPGEFIGLIKYARYVLSSSFHGLVFSIIYHKEVFVSFTNNSNRALTLLQALGIPERMIPARSDIPSSLLPIDYEKVNKRLEGLRSHSLEYLQTL